MRRVMALIGFSSFFVSFFCLFFKYNFMITLFAVASVALVVVLCVKKIRLSILIVLLCTVMLSCVNCYITNKNIENYEKIYCSGTIEISGKLVDYPEVSDSGFNYIFRTIDENKVKFGIMSNEMLDIEPGDTITGSFDFNSNYAELDNKIYFSTYTYSVSDIKVENKNGFNIAKLRKTLKQGIIDNTTYARGLAKAILFGDKSGLSDETYVVLQRCGLLHATATSGLHLTIVTGFVFALLSFLGVSRKKSSLFALCFIVAFMIVIGFKFSLMRAGIMMIVYFAANLFDRENDAFNSIGLSITFLVFQNPYTVISCSFLLSASATIGMFIIFKTLNEKLKNLDFKNFYMSKKIFVSVGASVLQSVSATIFTMPIIYMFFGYFSIAGILANAVLSIFISSILMLSLVLCLTAFLPVVPAILGSVLDVICLLSLKIASKIAEFNYCLVNIDSTYTAIAIFICFAIVSASILLYYFCEFDKKRIVKISVLLCINSALICVFANIIFPNKSIDVKVQNSSGGICVSAVSNNKMLVLDTGGKRTLKRLNYELTNNCLDKIDTLVVPSNDKAFNSAKQVINTYKTDNVLVDSSKYDLNEDLIDKRFNVSNGGSAYLGELKVEIIKQQLTDVFYLTNGKVSALIISKNTDCDLLPKEIKKCDVVVIVDEPPDDISKISANQAIVCSYEPIIEQKMANYCPTYSLISQSLEIEMSNNLKVKKV